MPSHPHYRLPGRWDQELGHYLGWLVGDGHFSTRGAVTIYGSSVEVEQLLPRHLNSLERWTGFRPKPSVQANGTRQLRLMKRDFVDYLLALGVAQAKSVGKVVPASILRAPHPALVAFLRGLFDADGCVVSDLKKGTHYVGLGSKSAAALADRPVAAHLARHHVPDLPHEQGWGILLLVHAEGRQDGFLHLCRAFLRPVHHGSLAEAVRRDRRLRTQPQASQAAQGCRGARLLQRQGGGNARPDRAT